MAEQLMVSHNMTIDRMRPTFYKNVDIIRCNSPWYTKEELINILKNKNKPMFLDINLKKRKKPRKSNISYKLLLSLANEYKVEWIGISNVEDMQTYDKIKKYITNGYTRICAKIETEIGCWHADDILRCFDGIMVDTEDLAYELGWDRAVHEKNRIYGLCERFHIPHFRLYGTIFRYIE